MGHAEHKGNRFLHGRGLAKQRALRPGDGGLSLCEHRLADGAVLYVVCHDAARETTHSVSLAARCLQVGCCLEGSVTESLPAPEASLSSLLEYSVKRGGLLCTPEAVRVWTFAPGTCRMVVACLPPRMVVDCWEAAPGAPPDVLKTLAGDMPPEPFSVGLPATPAMRMAARNVMDMPVQAAWRDRYLHCKITELFLLSTSALLARQATSKKAAMSLTRKDIACLQDARDILVARMEQPPTIKGLARLSGINECKLKRGFVQLFGMTPYTYLRQARLEQACRYLESGSMGVCEACMAVGYTSPSNFISLFRRRYGLTPGEVRRLTSQPLRDNPTASGFTEA
ncbi:AraC family transcriptional regulator [Solidesulfovibrio sp.]|uniref:helix-turn-helix transcriptional regulator n=1 Tax=Solidesulfovibrio sp. TaxID=2910990 RepID=UPI002B2095B1|nr:AraC family transcriptional regulator [Solidesulfovibrio sp.]MEA5088602.1 AraC family transcriptional regulator [Solidesulfovibrio sp.]HML59477.1 AraC family transcriptional regulator [Solidesulfovibrio sp.]